MVSTRRARRKESKVEEPKVEEEEEEVVESEQEVSGDSDSSINEDDERSNDVLPPTSSTPLQDDAGDESDRSRDTSNDSDSDNDHDQPASKEKHNVKEVLANLAMGEQQPAGHSNEVGNSLTELIPGYTAPMKLDTSSLNPVESITDLVRRAERTDKSTAGFVVAAPQAQRAVKSMKHTSYGFLPSTHAKHYSNFKMGTPKPLDTSAGARWFHMQPTKMTNEIKTDLALIRNRNYLDPKRFYKSADTTGSKNKTMIQVGTVIEGSAEFYSSRLSKRKRRTNLVEEIMADPASCDYAKRKYVKMTQDKQALALKRTRFNN